MKKLFVLVLLVCFIISCEKENKTYYSILIQKDTWGGRNKIVEKVDTIKVENDSLAMVKNYTSFVISNYNFIKLKSLNNDNELIQTIDYKLLDENKKPIVNILPDNVKKSIEVDVKKSIDESFKRIETMKTDVDSQFSSLDGSHIKLSEYIKSNMNNPDSYEHVETKFKESKDFLLVITKIRGENNFGAIITTTYEAKCNLNTGDVITISKK